MWSHDLRGNDRDQSSRDQSSRSKLTLQQLRGRHQQDEDGRLHGGRPAVAEPSWGVSRSSSLWHFLLRGRGQREGGGAGGPEWNTSVDLERLWIWSSDGANLCGRGTNGTNQTEAPPPLTKPPFQNKNRKSESTSCHSSIVCFWQHGNFSRFSSRSRRFWFPWRTRVWRG